MRGPGVLNHPPSDRNPQSDRSAFTAGSNLDSATDILGPVPHAAQTMSVVVVDDVESAAIVRNSQIEPPVFDLEIDTDFGSAGMPENVMNSFFEDEEDLPP